MSNSIANLAVILSVNTAKYGAGMQRAQGHTRQFSASFQKTMGGVFSTLRRITALVAGGGFIVALASQFKRLDGIAKQASKIGTTTEELSRLQFAAEQTGVEVATLNMAMQRMARRVAEAARGTGEAKDAIKEMGLDAVALNAMGPAKAMEEIADAMAMIPSQGDRVRLAMKLFDSEGVSLVNTLSSGSAALQQFAAESDRLGNTVDGKAAKSAEEFNDALNRMKVALGGVFVQLSNIAGPVITKFADHLSGIISSIQAMDMGTIRAHASNIAMVAALGTGIIVLQKYWNRIIAVIKATDKWRFSSVLLTSALGGVFTAIISVGAAALAGYAVNSWFDDMAESARQSEVAAHAASSAIVGVANGVAFLADSAKQIDEASDALEKLKKQAGSIFDATRTPLEKMESKLAEIRDLSEKGLIDEATTLRAIDAAKREAGIFFNFNARKFDELDRQMKSMSDRAASIFEATRTPAEQMKRDVEEINRLLENGFLDPDTAMRAINQLRKGTGSFAKSAGSPGERVSFAALGAAGATGRKTDAMLRLQRQQADSDKRREEIQKQNLDAVRSLSAGQAVEVIVF